MISKSLVILCILSWFFMSMVYIIIDNELPYPWKLLLVVSNLISLGAVIISVVDDKYV